MSHDELSDFAAYNDPEHGAIVAAARRIKIDARELLVAVQAVSIARRGSSEWSEHDLRIAESCLGAFLAAIKLWSAERRATRAQRDTAQPDEGDDNV